jgi:stress-induced-phosphoprotein 1
MADALKAEGNKAIAEKNFDEAMWVEPLCLLPVRVLAIQRSNTHACTLFSESCWLFESEKFTQAIEIEPTNHILYSNRSAAYASKKDYESALKDADKVTEIKPDWAKGWGRKGAAKHGLGDLIGALDAYEEGLKLDQNNAQNKSGLASVKRAIDAEAKEGKLACIWMISREKC